MRGEKGWLTFVVVVTHLAWLGTWNVYGLFDDFDTGVSGFLETGRVDGLVGEANGTLGSGSL